MNPLRRITTSGRFVPEIDGFRFLAITWVVLYHFQGLYPGQLGLLFGSLAQHGSTGVQLFFTISGFIIGLPFAAHYLTGKRPVNIGRYFLRRLTRLEPPYMLNIFLVFMFGVLISRKLSVSGDGGHLLASLFYVHNAIYGHESFVNTVAWSLEVEIQFYCLAPLLSKVFALRQRRALLVCTILATGAVQAFAPHPPARLTLSLLWQIQYFLAGFLLADIYVMNWKEMPPRSWRWDVVAAVAFPLVFSSTLTKLTSRVALPLCTVLLYSAIFRSRAIGSFFRWSPVTSLGGMCYTIYLYHDSVMNVLSRHIGSNIYIDGIVMSSGVIVSSCIMFLLVEKPCMKPEWYKLGRRRADHSP